jgi:predicted transcriptional regulator
MKFEKRQKARELRIGGKSVPNIAKELGVAKSSVSMWVRDIQLTEEQRKNFGTNQGKHLLAFSQERKISSLKLRQKYQEDGRKRAAEHDLLHCMGCMLFWAEGTKDKNTITFTNSDVHMLRIFLRFLRECFHVTNNQITVRINCFIKHEADWESVKLYWKNELGIDESMFRKPTTKVTDVVENYGVCALTVCNTELAQQIYGSIQEYGGFNNGMCLENKRTRRSNQMS